MISKLQKGFTLIELLIVIAVLAVLAAVALVAIDPVEQIDRGRDSGRKTAVGQLGHATEAYATAQTTNGLYPSTVISTWTATTWQTFLKTAGEVKNTIINTPRLATNVCPAANAESNYCYTVNANRDDFIIWVVLESKSEKARGGCAATAFAIAAYQATQGKAGTTCVATAGTVPGFTPALNLQ